MENNDEIKNIVILGGGYGGIRTALNLGKFLAKNKSIRTKWALYLVDRKNSHIFTPTLYEMATVLKEEGSALNIKSAVSVKYDEIFNKLPVHFIQDEIKTINHKNKTVSLRDSGNLIYKILILALGSETNFFSIEGLETCGLPLKTTENAIVIRNALNKIISDDSAPPSNIIIGGGGAVGVELAAELTHFIHKKESKENKLLHHKNHIMILEAGDTILAGMPEKVITNVHEHLKKSGIIIKEKTAIKKVDKDIVYAENNNKEEKISYSVLIWAGGTRINPITETLNVEKDKRGRCLVKTSLELKNNEKENKDTIYAIGDLTCFNNPLTKKPLPATAFIAIEQAKIVAENIVSIIKSPSGINPKTINYFAPAVYPFAIPLGGKKAVFNYGSITISGFAGWIIRILIDLRYFLTILPFQRAIKFWLNSISLIVKND